MYQAGDAWESMKPHSFRRYPRCHWCTSTLGTGGLGLHGFTQNRFLVAITNLWMSVKSQASHTRLAGF